jgi:hypothetical protein
MTSPSERLIAVMLAHANEPYALGTSDCITFATASFEAWSGREAPWREHVSTYRTQAGVKRLLKKLKAKDAGDVFAQHLQEIPPAFAGMGDLVTHHDALGLVAMGVCEGETFAARGETGLIHLPMARALRAFKSV